MNIFLVVQYKREASQELDLNYLEDYLVTTPKGRKIYKSDNRKTQIYSWSINERSNREYHEQLESSALAFDGLPLIKGQATQPEGHRKALLSGLKPNPTSFLKRLYGEYSIAFTDGKETYLSSNLGGSHILYYVETPEFVAFTNRSPLLLGLPGVSAELSDYAASSFCYQGYVTEGLTAFQSIRKLAPGATAHISASGRLTIHDVKHRDLIADSYVEKFAANPMSAFEEVLGTVTDYLAAYQQHHPGLSLNVPLSGGKDSRLILAFLVAAGLKDQLHIWTRGPLYSHDVIPAQDLCAKIGYTKHEIRRPSVSVQSQMSATTVVRSIDYHEGNLSLYDFQGMSRNEFITVGGHQNALRPGSFSDCRTDKIEHFLADAMKVRHHDPLGVLTSERRGLIAENYRGFFRQQLDDGVPLSDLGDMYYLRQRNPNWVGVHSNSDYYSGPFTNPLNIGDAYRFVFSVPKFVRDFELFHLIGIGLCEPKFLDVPFGNQTWEPGVSDVLAKIGAPFKCKPLVPYRSHKAFPNMANPYITNTKVEYVQTLAPCINKLLLKHRTFYEAFMDIRKTTDAMANAKTLDFPKLYAVMGIYNSVLLKEFGTAMFKQSERASVISEINKMLEK